MEVAKVAPLNELRPLQVPARVPDVNTSGWTSAERAQNAEALAAQGLPHKERATGVETGDVQLGEVKQPILRSLRTSK